MRFRTSLLPLLTAGLVCAGAVSALAADPHRMILKDDARTASFELRTAPSGQDSVAVVIRQGPKKAAVSITPEEIAFDDGYSIRRSVEWTSPDEYVETLTAYTPDRTRSATAEIRLKAPLVIATGRREVAALLGSSASYRLLVDNREFIAERTSKEPRTADHIFWNGFPATLAKIPQGRGDLLVAGAFYLTSVANLIVGGPEVTERSKAVVLRGTRLDELMKGEE